MKPSVLVLTEDGGKDGKPAFETVTALTKRLLAYIDQGCDPEKISFDPATDAAREILVANQFTNRRDPRRRRLYQVIAAQLKLADGFVVHHFDGDRPWCERDAEAPLEAKPVQKEILEHVRVLLATRGVSDPRSTRCSSVTSGSYRIERSRPGCTRTPRRRAASHAAGRSVAASLISTNGAQTAVSSTRSQSLRPRYRASASATTWIWSQDYRSKRSTTRASRSPPLLDAMVGCDALLETLQRTAQRTYQSPRVSPTTA
jgi:hypothetical protein